MGTPKAHFLTVHIILHVTTGQRYVGITRNAMEVRLRQHLKRYTQGADKPSRLTTFWQQYNNPNEYLMFALEYLENVEMVDAKVVEKNWIQKMKHDEKMLNFLPASTTRRKNSTSKEPHTKRVRAEQRDIQTKPKRFAEDILSRATERGEQYINSLGWAKLAILDERVPHKEMALKALVRKAMKSKRAPPRRIVVKLISRVLDPDLLKNIFRSEEATKTLTRNQQVQLHGVKLQCKCAPTLGTSLFNFGEVARKEVEAPFDCDCDVLQASHKHAKWWSHDGRNEDTHMVMKLGDYL